jgi:O-antigen/teichoic acid export membrane protein
MRTLVTREVLWVATGQLVAALGVVVGVRFLTTNLTPQQYGELAVGLTGAIFVGQLVVGPLTSAFVRFFSPALEGTGFTAYLEAIRRLGKCFVVASGTAVGILLLAGMLFSSRWILIAIPAICFSALSGAEQSLDGIQNAARQRSVVALHLALGAWGRLLAVYAVFHWFGASSVSALWGFTCATSLLLVSQGWFYSRRIARLAAGLSSPFPADRAAWISKILKFSRPFALWGTFHWALLVSDRYALGLFQDSGTLGLYNVVYQIGYYPVTILAAMTMQLVVPILYNMAGDASDSGRLQRSRTLTRRLAGLFAASSAVAATVAWAIHEPLFKVLVGPTYRDVSHFLPLVLLAAGLFTAAQIAGQSPLLELDARRLLVPKLVTTSLGVVLNLVGAYFYGIDGVVWAGVAFSLVFFIWMLWLGRKSGGLPSAGTHVHPVTEQLAGSGIGSTQLV